MLSIGVASWTKKLDVFSYDLLMFPINHSNLHWCLATADIRNNTISYYDSMLGSGLSGTITHHYCFAARLPCMLLAQDISGCQLVILIACLPHVLPACLMYCLLAFCRQL